MAAKLSDGFQIVNEPRRVKVVAAITLTKFRFFAIFRYRECWPQSLLAWSEHD
ncbi:MAG: hypothetical protein MPJ50_13000 [Pirellulales bacterium]|nr:hypothetical protein [Pirellulales bacterium]